MNLTSSAIHSASDLEPWLDEVKALAAVGSHPNITGYHDSWLEPGQDGGPHQHIKLELCNGGNLGSHVKAKQPLQSDELWSICRQVASALKLVHSLGWAHLDVKPDNIYRSYDEGGPPTLGPVNPNFNSNPPVLSASPSFTLAQSQALSVPLMDHNNQNVAPESSNAKPSPCNLPVGPCRFVLGDFGLAAPRVSLAPCCHVTPTLPQPYPNQWIKGWD